MALHALAQSEEAFEKSQMFAMVPDDEMPRLAAEKHEKREKRARRKANQKAKKTEAALAQAEEERRAREEEEATALAARKANLIPVHESLVEALAKGRL